MSTTNTNTNTTTVSLSCHQDSTNSNRHKLNPQAHSFVPKSSPNNIIAATNLPNNGSLINSSIPASGKITNTKRGDRPKANKKTRRSEKTYLETDSLCLSKEAPARNNPSATETKQDSTKVRDANIVAVKIPKTISSSNQSQSASALVKTSDKACNNELIIPNRRLLMKTLHHLSNNFTVKEQEVVEDVSGAYAKMVLNLVPSEQDFPFDLESLILSFQVIPNDGYRAPTNIKVLNTEIPRSFSVNIEAALAKHCFNEGKNHSIVSHFKWLDKHLSSILAQPEANIIKFVRRKNLNPEETPCQQQYSSPSSENAGGGICLAKDIIPQEIKDEKILAFAKTCDKINTLPHHSQDKVVAPSAETFGQLDRRRKDISQIERRFRKSYQLLDENSERTQFQIRFEPSDPDYAFRRECSYFVLKLNVPILYPNKDYPVWIEVSPGRANPKMQNFMLRNVENGFNEYAVKAFPNSILHCINWLDSHLEKLLRLPCPTPTPPQSPPYLPDLGPVEEKEQKYLIRRSDFDNPIEGKYNELVEESESESKSEAVSDSETDIEPEIKPSKLPEATPHCGVQIKAPTMDKLGISLIHMGWVEVEVGCNRCKARLSAPRLTPNKRNLFSCPKCSQSLGLQFRPTLMHLDSDSIGYLDTLECTPQVLYRVAIIPTCEECLHQNSELPSFKTVHLNSTRSDNCRQCHKRMETNIKEIKFVRLAPSTAGLENHPQSTSPTLTAQLLGPGSIKKEKIPTNVGEPLPKFGACRHYRRSNRWLRFPCCGKAYPCGTCHDDAVQGDHDMIYANYMVCGYCSNETKFKAHNQSPQCNRCGHTLTSSSRGKAFWEGGKGTRDTSKMNKNDPKKYAGKNKTISRAKQNAA